MTNKLTPNITYKTMPYLNNDLGLIDKLTRLSFKDGHLRNALLRSPHKLKYIVLALGPRDGILGWAGIYSCYGFGKPGEKNVGVYVRRGYRHNGIGMRLREIAIEKVLRKSKSVYWHERYRGKYRPIERRRP